MHGNIIIVTVQKICYYCFMKWAAYLEEHFGIPAASVPVKKDELKKLPLYLRSGFNLFQGKLADRNVIWAETDTHLEFTPDKLFRQGQDLKKYFRLPVIFIFDKLDSWNRKRLIEKRVSFLQPHKQLYAPDLLIELSDVPGIDNVDNFNEFLSFPAQCLLLYHLQMENLENRPFQNIANTLGYSKMTVSRAVRELVHYSLAEITEGKEKGIVFEFNKRSLWKKALPFLRSPVMDVWFSNVIHAYKGFIEGGEWALSTYTMISNPEVLTYAIGKQAFRKWEKETGGVHLDRKYGSRKIEVWHYDPLLLVPDTARVADKLSVYLSLKDEKDERVQGELRELINKVL